MPTYTVTLTVEARDERHDPALYQDILTEALTTAALDVNGTKAVTEISSEALTSPAKPPRLDLDVEQVYIYDQQVEYITDDSVRCTNPVCRSILTHSASDIETDEFLASGGPSWAYTDLYARVTVTCTKCYTEHEATVEHSEVA